MDEEKLNVLVIDDDPVYRNLSRSILKERFNVYVAENPMAGFRIMDGKPINFVICDYMLPEMDGLKVLERIKKDHPQIEVILISNAGTMDTVIDALRKGAADYFKKPFTATELWMSIERTRKFMILNKDLQAERKKKERLKKEVSRELGMSIIGNSSQIDEIKDQMAMVAKTPDTSVLIIGESGTGKELVARGIHDMSSRSDEMFGAVNMSAIPENLFESEFFGHKKGSFTGAIADKAGWFESADKGTLFLDEIGEMSLSLQVKLLRVLEDHSYTSVGSSKSQSYDIRIIAATNKSVETLTSQKAFRLDLFHRLGTFIIELPPLRERKDDIPVLAKHFLHRLTEKMGKSIQGICPEATEMLLKYNFPGNIRELKNMMERAVILCTESQIQPRHFSFLNHHPVSKTNGQTDATIWDLKSLEKQTIIRALEKTHYNKAEASRLLNLEWNALYRRIQKYGIQMDS